MSQTTLASIHGTHTHTETQNRQTDTTKKTLETTGQILDLIAKHQPISRTAILQKGNFSNKIIKIILRKAIRDGRLEFTHPENPIHYQQAYTLPGYRTKQKETPPPTLHDVLAELINHPDINREPTLHAIKKAGINLDRIHQGNHLTACKAVKLSAILPIPAEQIMNIQNVRGLWETRHAGVPTSPPNKATCHLEPHAGKKNCPASPVQNKKTASARSAIFFRNHKKNLQKQNARRLAKIHRAIESALRQIDAPIEP